jgi:hypothetical protein
MSKTKPQTQEDQSLARPEEFDVVTQWDGYVSDLPSEIDLDRAQAEAGFVSKWIHRYDTGAMVAKFCLGTIAYLANPAWRNETKYGQSIIKNLSEEHSINANVLREARRCSEFFGLDLSLYYDWVTEDDRLKTWTDVRKLIRAWNDPDVLGPENLAERLARRIESTSDDLQRLRERVHEGDIDRETYEGVEQEFLREVESFDQEKEEALEEPKDETPRDEEYIQWVKSQSCVATNAGPPNEAHHVEQGGMAGKGSDYSVVPLCREAHQFTEDHGHSAAEEKYNFRFGQSVAKMIHKYYTGSSISFPNDISVDIK